MASVMGTKKALLRKHALDQGLQLAARAGLDRFQYGTSVVRSDDSTFRVGVGSGTSPWGDHVSIQVMDEVEGNAAWRFAHFSPAKARLIAHHLLTKADMLEGKL